MDLVLLSDYVAALKGGWKIILSTVVVALILAMIPTLRAAPTYSTSTDLFVATSANTNDPEELYQRNAIAAQRMPSYVVAVSGDVVSDKVVDELGGDLDASVTAESISGTVVLRITVTGSDAEHVRDVASAYADVMPDVIADIEEVGDPDATQLRVSVIDAADVPSASPRSFLPGLVLALVLGLGLGLVIVVARETLRRERRAAPTSDARDI
jgi:capsular polysaccharide biosynthesis protein